MSSIPQTSIKSRGFTLVELLIAIVVIAILAAISVVAYNGVQARAKDAALRAGASQVEKALLLWRMESGVNPLGGSGSIQPLGSNKNCTDGSGEGWIVSGVYQCSLEDILVKAGYLPAGFIRKLPKNASPTAYGNEPDGAFSMMIYECNDPGEYALYWTLYQPTAADAASMTAVEAAGCDSVPRTQYGQKAAKIIQF